MRLDLTKLDPNPFRDFTVDPMDERAIVEIEESIADDGFWSGVTARPHPEIKGRYQIAAGHTRVASAIKHGLTHADIYVDNFDNEAMIRIYARENALQRGNTGTAIAGSVASATRYLLKMILVGQSTSEFRSTYERFAKTFDIDFVLSNIGNAKKGLGRDAILFFLGGIRGITRNAVDEQMANLKASGNYARILDEVNAEVAEIQAAERAELKRREEELEKARETQRKADEAARKAEEQRKAAAAEREEAARREAKRKAQEAKERAEAQQAEAKRKAETAEKEVKKLEHVAQSREVGQKAAEAAKARPVTFDFTGVSKHLRSALQIQTFRDIAESEGMRQYLPVNQQANLARKLAETAAKTGSELSGTYIKDNMMAELMGAKHAAAQAAKKAREEKEAADAHERWYTLAYEFVKAVASMKHDGLVMVEHMKKHPNLKFKFYKELEWAIRDADQVVSELVERLDGKEPTKSNNRHALTH